MLDRRATMLAVVTGALFAIVFLVVVTTTSAALVITLMPLFEPWRQVLSVIGAVILGVSLVFTVLADR